jgi:hypothetical protein
MNEEKQITVYEGEVLSLICQIEGVPQPKQSWSKFRGDMPEFMETAKGVYVIK